MSGLTIDFLGHSTLVIELDGIRLITDPAVRGRIGPLRRTTHEPERRHLDGIDAVLVSHLHWDHLDLPSLRRIPGNPLVVVPRGAGRWLRGQGFDRVVETSAGEQVSIAGLTVSAVPARHGGTRPPAGPTALALGFVIRGRRTVYFAGDTDLFPSMADLRGAIDTALLPVWGWGPTLRRGVHLDPGRAAEAAALIEAPTVVPIHWGTYWPSGLGRIRRDRLVEPPRELHRAVAERGGVSRVHATEVGDRLRLP